MAVSSPSSAPAKKSKWLRGNKKVIGRYLGEARAALAAAAQDDEGGDDAATAALGLVAAVLDMSPRVEAALELRARALLALRRYRDVADMLSDYIPSCGKSCSGDEATSSSFFSSSSCSSGSGDLAAASRNELLSRGRDRSDAGAGASRFLCCFDVSELKRRLVAGFSKNSSGDAQWRYLVLGQACFHLGLMEDAVVLLQTGRRLASAAFRRESVCWSEDNFSPSNLTANAVSVPASRRASKSGSAPVAPVSEAESVSQLLAHVKLLLRRRAAAVAALDAGIPGEAVRHFNKVLDARRGVLPHPFATACLVGRAAAFRSSGRPADAIADCNRALALDPAFIPALRARADLLESVGALPDCLRDLDHLKLLYDAALRDSKLPGPSWRPQGGIRFSEIAGAHRTLTARMQQLRGRVTAGEGCSVDYHSLLGVQRGCTRPELERAHLLLTLKLKPDRSASFAERLELVDEHRDLEAVRDQARMSALFLYRMLQKGYSFIMSAVLKEEAAERQRAKDAAATAALAAVAASGPKQQQEEEEVTVPKKPMSENVPSANGGIVQVAMPEAMAPVIPMPRTVVTAATAATTISPPFQGVFCRDMAVVGTLLTRGGFDRPIPVKCEAISC
ncbi:uncharacterized protein LOC133892042 [Phragmites australis]|uniref:uncharacterized protein LOC133892042 n=1 Tax=Phragmites australis TaxID=29695 RepID=UPI002D780E03|nr:uncharacterized protein LOC133892042 [Phragmites australis]